MEFRIHLHFLMAHPIIAPEKKTEVCKIPGVPGNIAVSRDFQRF